MFKHPIANLVTESKIKKPKIMPFCNLKCAKIPKKCEKIFLASNFGRYDLHKSLKNGTKRKRRLNAFTSHIFVYFSRMPPPSKYMPNIVIIRFYPIFALLNYFLYFKTRFVFN